ncbi:hypothetical protein ACWOBH_06235 [Globicatella sanguinis]
MARAFGFGESAMEMEKYHSKADNAMKELEKIADDMMDEARDVFMMKSPPRTHKGEKGIVQDKKGSTITIGWSGRPGLHGYFHELGFHALDNRRKQIIPRTRKSRKRVYRRVKATYVPPRPHMRPAFDKYNKDIEIRVQNKIT